MTVASAGDDDARRQDAHDAEAQDAAAEVATRVLAQAPRLGRVRLVCIDGPAGSGKTSFAARLAERLAADAVRVGTVHLDDLYEGWSGLEGTLWQRVTAQVLEPLRAGMPGRYQRYDWVAGAFADWVDVPVPDVLVLEGCGAARRAAAPDAVLMVWVEAPAELRLARGLERDGEAMRDEWTSWTMSEAAHFDRERTRVRADVRLDAYGRMTP
ncbi:MAG TPA: uridine kinase [Cellulomonas sp.]|uniref:uridine kinase n=1 Tax=Cellulomonas sp. TaxID=40001 RepID=UPI002E307687|nr:uridine kinase [Cellulomonas sp.]HEX5332138.1 uridine kinase [Cellulomonas sp.]